ncbi:MAG: phosphoribosylformylglycinamidine synthase subunit PurQ [Alphaproteobacteria bacterium]|nr:phosphoribosylformylglycinamidine synthase subunit PurQ [Alphaproteobacteria bacterium]
MRACVVVFPGSNCDRDVAVALRQATGADPVMVWHRDADVPAVDLIVLPGGFSYGDYLRSGAMAAHSPIMRSVIDANRRGTPVLAICNGFQVATEAGLLPGVLMPNAHQKFVCRDVTLRVETSQSIFTSRYTAGQVVRIPIAHHDGNYHADAATLNALDDQGLVAFRYCDADGRPSLDANPNGAQRNIAGIFSRDRTVLGLMPHPERAAEPAHGGTDGRALFDSLLAALG